MAKRCSNCANYELRGDGERKVTDTCANCNWVKVDENKEPSNWMPLPEAPKEKVNETDKV